MNTKNIENVYPLSPMQQGMVFHSIAAPESGVYIEQLNCALRGALDVAAFECAWQRVLDRYAILRTSFIGEGLKEPVQVVHRQVKLPFEFQDWRDTPTSEQPARLSAFLADERRRGFVLTDAPLMRVALMRVTNDMYEFVWQHHHALLDGWSVPIVLQEVFAFYHARCRNQALQLPPPRPYRDYIVWLRKQDLRQAEDFWRRTLKGFTAPTPLIVDRAIKNADAAHSAEVETRLSLATTNVLQSVARQNRLTLNTLVQGAWALLLSRYSGEEDVVFGATVSGRPAELPGAETMVGLFINTLPVRVRVTPNLPVVAWLQELQTQQVELRQYEYTPLVQIQSWSEAPRGLSLFDSILVFENLPVSDSLREQDDDLEILNYRSVEQTNYPLTAVAGPSSELMLKIVYDNERFDQPTITRMLGHWRTLLEGIAENPSQSLAALPLLTQVEREQILVEWNDTTADYVRDRCAHELFEQQVARTPNAIAVTLGEARLTYRELNARANQLAHHLRELGVKPETLVAICMERSLEMIVAVLGVLKAGGAYVPLDPTYPFDRLAFVLDDSRAPILLTQSHLTSRLPQHPIQICLDTDWEKMTRESDANLPLCATPENLVYVIYTSGSTGKPKGTLLQHRGLCNLIAAYHRDFGIGATSRVLQFFSFGFDGSVADIFSALLNGATLCLTPPDAVSSINDFERLIAAQHITVAMLPPALLALLPSDGLSDLQTIISAGESCRRDDALRWARRRQFFNGYGPTEVTVAASWYRVEELDSETTIPIGRPIANAQIYILDQQLQPVPVGVPGELHIGGVGLARGYLNRPELTAEKFIHYQLPIANRQSPIRLYKTGDLGRFRADGNIEFLGRIDHQVKLRGFRIELGEIETVLREHPAVQDAVVLAREDPPGEKRLVAYVISVGEITTNDLSKFLQTKLPAYMTPAAFVMMEAFPLNASGKVDRRALPAPDHVPVATARVVIPPRDTLEFELAQIWEKILGVHPIGVRDNFFELGGHSLLALRLSALVQQELGQSLPLVNLFQEPTIEHLASVLRGAEMTTPTVVPIQPHGTKPPIFFVHPSGGSVHWYTELAESLGADQPFYGLQARGVHGDAELHTRVEDMAAFYLDAMRAQQTNGPYRIGSWSMGVSVAYEMAQQLRALNQPVSLLALLDQGPTLGAKEPEDDAAYLVDTFGKHIPLATEQLRQLEPHEQIAHVWRQARQAEWLYPDVTLDQFSHFIRILRTHTDAFRQYKPQRYAGKVTLFRAEERPADDPPAHDLGWGALATQGVEIHSVPGDHLSMIHEPHVQVLAEKLKGCLDETP
ncbi:MAG: amino acid adenylation domain-containing protein [Chloroflexi bacterium]|nr:amino acid adenylation domain-containing protein [Chloroflexota bacterium]